MTTSFPKESPQNVPSPSSPRKAPHSVGATGGGRDWVLRRYGMSPRPCKPPYLRLQRLGRPPGYPHTVENRVTARGADYSQCWASCLGDCEGVISHEHLISECLFPDGGIMVQGLDWCKDAPNSIPIKSFTGKILCERHNNGLSEVDAAVKQSLDTLREAAILFIAREKVRARHWALKSFNADMLLLERWCLKTLINFNQHDGFPIDPEAPEPHKPTKELVEVAFGLKRFADPSGLYVIFRSGDQFTLNEGDFSISTMRMGERLAGAEFSLWGVPFFLNLLSTPYPMHGAKLLRHNIEYCFQTFDDKGRSVKSHLVKFTYPRD